MVSLWREARRKSLSVDVNLEKSRFEQTNTALGCFQKWSWKFTNFICSFTKLGNFGLSNLYFLALILTWTQQPPAQTHLANSTEDGKIQILFTLSLSLHSVSTFFSYLNFPSSSWEDFMQDSSWISLLLIYCHTINNQWVTSLDFFRDPEGFVLDTTWKQDKNDKTLR